jgi:hypothetical protein
MYSDNGDTDFLKRRYNSNRLQPHTTEDHNLHSPLHKNLKSHKGKGEDLGLPGCDALWPSHSFSAQRYVPGDVSRLQSLRGNHEFRKGKVIPDSNRQKWRCIAK